MTALDGPTREFGVFSAPPVHKACDSCADGSSVLALIEVKTSLQLAGGRTGGWRAVRCGLHNGWHMVRRTRHARSAPPDPAGLVRGGRLIGRLAVGVLFLFPASMAAYYAATVNGLIPW
ncbi:hypothetical protein [Longispora urticae]